MGLLREKLHIKPFYLNLRYSYDDQNYLRWLQGSSNPTNINPRPLPYMFVRINTKQLGWANICKQLWTKSLAIHRTHKSEGTLKPAINATTTRPIKVVAMNSD